MIYLCTVPDKGRPATTAFISRGLPQYTVGTLSRIGPVGKALTTQIAYAGYVKNIGAFLAATADGKKKYAGLPHYPIREDYIPSFPLPLPQVLLRLEDPPTPSQREKFEAGLAKEGLTKVQLGKGEISYALAKPTYSTCVQKLPLVCANMTGRMDDYSQVIANQTVAVIWQCIDLFCAVNTYSYKKEDFNQDSNGAKTSLDSIQEIRVESNFYREGYNKNAKVIKRSEFTDISTHRKIDDDEENDLTPYLSTYLPSAQPVTICKKSLLPSKTSFGSPTEVPNKTGLLFPYFEGMLNPDTGYVRDVIGRHFFKNLGDKDSDPRAGYKLLREHLGFATTTPQGIALGHVLCGVDLALETQTQAFFIFDGQKYLGFCLLGEEFHVYVHGKWHVPLEAKELRAELRTLRSHDSCIEELVVAISQCKSSDGDTMIVEKDDIDTCQGLATQLAKIDVSDEGDEVNEVAELVKHLNFEGEYRTLKPESVAAAIVALTLEKEKPLSATMKFYIPPKDWRGIDRREWMVLGTFGPKSFSFRQIKGDTITIPSVRDVECPLLVKTAEGKHKYGRMIVYEKGIRQAVTEWREFEGLGEMKADYTERAAGSRANVYYPGKGLEVVWSAMYDAAKAGLIGKGLKRAVAEDAEAGPSVKKNKGKARAKASIDDLF